MVSQQGAPWPSLDVPPGAGPSPTSIFGQQGANLRGWSQSVAADREAADWGRADLSRDPGVRVASLVSTDGAILASQVDASRAALERQRDDSVRALGLATDSISLTAQGIANRTLVEGDWVAARSALSLGVVGTSTPSGPPSVLGPTDTPEPEAASLVLTGLGMFTSLRAWHWRRRRRLAAPRPPA